MIWCAECNEENMDGLEYCDSCGAKLVDLPMEAETVEAAEAADSPAAEEVPATVDADTQTGAAEATGESAEAEDEGSTEGAEEAPAVVAPSDTQAAGGSATLTITRGGTVGKVFDLQAGDNLIGRWDPDSGSFPEVDMENDDPEARISRKHALIKFGTGLTIEDIGSLNGTFVNRGQRLEPGTPVPLKDGDEIIVGKTFFKVACAQ